MERWQRFLLVMLLAMPGVSNSSDLPLALGRRQATAPQVILVVIAILGSSGETHDIGSKATRENFFTADALHADLMDKKVKILACTE
jgi:hypothetical protein